MLKFGNKEFRNLQEQVEENMKDIEKLKSGQAVLDEFGIKVVGEVSDIEDLPTVSEYKEETPDWEYGDAYAVGTDAPYTLYILTRANGTHEADYWFDIGVFPAPGPQGEEGPQGQTGPQGPTGPSGADGAAAGFGTPTASAYTLGVGQAPRVEIATSGPNTEKVFDFTFYIPVGEAEVTITASNLTGTLTQTEYNKLDNYDNSIIKFHAGEYLNYILKKWYRNADYLVFIGLSGYETFSTSVYKCVIDRTTRAYTLSVLQPIKVDKGNISTKINSNTNETSGKVLTADGNGGASWEDPAGATDVVNVTSGTTAGYFSDAEYTKVAGDNCIIVYGNGARYYRKDSETSTTITYIGLYDLSTTSAVYKIEITKSSKYYTLSSSNLSVTNSNIKTGSLVADKFLKSNGSGGSTWGDGPSQVQADWNQTSQSSPAYIKNKPTIPTVPVTDVTVNGTSVLDGTVAKVLVNTVDGTIGGTSGNDWTSLTINGSTAYIPAAQVQADWNESDNTDPSYIQNKPSIPAAQVNSDWNAVSGVAQILNKPTIPDVSHMVTDNTTQTITGAKTFDGGLGVSDGNIEISDGNIEISNGIIEIQQAIYDQNDEILGYNYATIGSEDPSVDPKIDLIDFDGLKTNGSTYKLKIPSTSAYTADKTIATTDQLPNGVVFLTTSNTTTDIANALTANKLPILINGNSYYMYSNVSSNIYNFYKVDSSGWLTIYSCDYNGWSYSTKSTVQGATVNGTSVVTNGTANIVTNTAYDSTNNKIATMSDLPTVPTNISSFTNDSGYITGINSSDVTTALGYTPLNSTACTYQTTAPTAAATDGGVHIVYLSSEPSTKYSGYIYMIAEA